MMKTKHTPGPWFVVPYGDGEATVICEDEAGNHRITFMALPGSRYRQVRRKRFSEINANAHLIAAAPELLEALEALFAEYKALADSGDAGNWRLEDEDVGKQAIAAIVKARGKTQ